MKDPLVLLPYLDGRGASNAGICIIKRRNHEEWYNRIVMDAKRFHSKKLRPIEQTALAVGDYLQQSSAPFQPIRGADSQLRKGVWTLKEYEDYAKLQDSPSDLDLNELEDLFWENVGTHHPRLYAADMQFSMMEPSAAGLNFNRYSSYTERFNPVALEGIDKPFSYCGTWMTNFPWHTEESELYSMNICYEGRKGWYSIDRDSTKDVMEFFNTVYADVSGGCANFVEHKRIIMSAQQLEYEGFHVHKVSVNNGE